MKALRVIIAILLLPFSYSFAIQFYSLFAAFDFQRQMGFWISFSAAFLVFFIFLRQTSFFAILKHELSHNLFVILTFHKPVALHVTSGKGGEFHYNGRANPFMLLAPYFFPLTASVLLLISLFNIQAQNLYFAILGVAIAFDLSTSLKDIHLKQSDLRYYGLFFSFSFILLALLICYGMILAFVFGGFSNAGNYFVEGFLNVWERMMAIGKLLG